MPDPTDPRYTYVPAYPFVALARAFASSAARAASARVAARTARRRSRRRDRRRGQRGVVSSADGPIAIGSGVGLLAETVDDRV
ncbi:hypothetical protein, partial [Halarchaeum acidiphilum]|uniref:hypothetical protein n=1 Tax=Halarchaeum acidiphilum TaxID=489138 RepID=UPI0005D279E6